MPSAKDRSTQVMAGYLNSEALEIECEPLKFKGNSLKMIPIIFPSLKHFPLTGLKKRAKKVSFRPETLFYHSSLQKSRFMH